MLEVIPSPGTTDTVFSSIEKKIELIKPFIRTLHVDIVDGKFAPNTTFMDPAPFKKFSTELLLEVHFMTDNPLQYLKQFADCGFKRFIGQIEKMENVEEFVAQGQLLGEVGLAIDGPTPLSSLTVELDDLDCLLIMTIKAGQSGQQFMPEHLEKVEELRSRCTLPIEVDGGVSDTNIVQAKDAGATRFVSTGFIFGNQKPVEQLKKLQVLINPTQ